MILVLEGASTEDCQLLRWCNCCIQIMKTMLVEEHVVACSLCWQERGTWLTSAGLWQAVLQMLITVDLIQDVYVFSGFPLASFNHRLDLGIIRQSVLQLAFVWQRTFISGKLIFVMVLKYSQISNHYKNRHCFDPWVAVFCCCELTII